MKKLFEGLFILWIVFFVSVPAPAQKTPLTVAESSNFTATSRYADVISFIEALQRQSNLFHVETLCTSAEGRKVPLLIVGNPVPNSPRDLKYDNRMVVYIQANIHAGEVEGKEAVLMLLRDILQQENPPYLDKLVLLLEPIFNADGNEKISPGNRRNQDGPKAGVGIRYNGQNFDLNRDGMKLESIEVRALVKNVLLKWDPVLLVDCHTTDGSYHEEPLTFSAVLNPNGSQAVLRYMWDNMMPAIQKRFKEKFHTLSIPYGNWRDRSNPEKGWQTFGHQPRYLTNYVGVRNRMAILIENYAHADFKTRVYGNYNYLRSILDYFYENRDEIARLIKQTDQGTIHRGMNPTAQDSFAVEVDLQPQKEKVTILGWKTKIEKKEGRQPRFIRTDEKKTYVVPYYTHFVPKKQVRFPYGYLIPVYAPDITQKLLQHGITVEKLTEPVKIEVEAFKLDEMKGSLRLFQGHRMNSVKGKYVMQKKEFPAGALFVSTAQPLANLVASLLEPESDDGLLVWNFFDRYLAAEWRRTPQTYPVYKLYTPVNLVKKVVN
ncbi:MAG TPA: hypothetical protein ENH29_04900 [Bacteroidetes bacterium]|nr:hypothetical protein [Bacteroidota bacterium]